MGELAIGVPAELAEIVCRMQICGVVRMRDEFTSQLPTTMLL